jgi:hypothetical protein
MPLPNSRLRTLTDRLWAADAPLTAVGLLMLPLLALFLAGLWLDPRVITGAPAWLKPAKFAASIAIYTLTLAWIFTYLPAWRRTRLVVGWTTAVVMVLEMVVIAGQAARGRTSHFNIATPLDIALFAIMGTAILVQTLSSIAVAVALWREELADRTLGWALRLGLVITILGAFTGGLMTRPTQAQLADAAVAGTIAVAGAHTVGAPDGGPGLPGTGWSVEHGDIRVPHFIGLHAVQALGLFALVLARRRIADAARVRLMLTAAASYATLFALLLWQALRGQPLVAPDATMATAIAAWAVLTAAVAWLAVRDGRPQAHALVA